MMEIGDRLTIGLGEQSAECIVRLTSSNDRSLIVEFEAILAGHVGAMPILKGDDGVFRSVVTGDVVTLTPL